MKRIRNVNTVYIGDVYIFQTRIKPFALGDMFCDGAGRQQVTKNEKEKQRENERREKRRRGERIALPLIIM
jgi:hypothetical protein